MPRYYKDEGDQWWYEWGAKPTRSKARVRPCERCGKDFPIRASSPARFCSKSCGAQGPHIFTKPHNKPKPGPGNPNWRGGRQKLNGYIIVYAPSHPSKQGSNKPYVQEHRLVMEQMIGRFLEPWEQVHHKNGVRDDNRPENLELWQRSHPYGVRSSDVPHCPTCTCFQHKRE